jgi:hypothetical protein
MGSSEFYGKYFQPDFEQQKIIEEFKRIRRMFGSPHRLSYFRSLARTSKYTHTVYPPKEHFN